MQEVDYVRSAAVVASMCAALSTAPAAAAVLAFDTDPVPATTPFSSSSAGLTATFTGSIFADAGAFEISDNSTSGPLPLATGTVPSGYHYAEGTLSCSGPAFTVATFRTGTSGLAIDTAELRDQIVDARNQSTTVTVGFPLARVDDAVAGRVKITPATFGAD